MPLDLIQLLLAPDEYVCCWRDGELFIERVEAPVAAFESDIPTSEVAPERKAA